MAAFDSGRLGELFRQRTQIAENLHQAQRIAERLTLDHNSFVREASQAVTAGGRQRAQGRANRKGEEADRARAEADRLSRELHQKETEIADLIGALWAASQSLLSADAVRQHSPAPVVQIPNLNRYKPDMVQFSGHGTADGVLMMGPRDRSEPVAAARLIQMFKWTSDDLRVVFFNICDSEAHARAAAQLVEATIGMRGKMHDTPARMFAAHLYSGLAFGNSLKKAFQQACAAIGDEPDSAIPQLFFRNGIDPHGVVLVRPEGGDVP